MSFKAQLAVFLELSSHLQIAFLGIVLRQLAEFLRFWRHVMLRRSQRGWSIIAALATASVAMGILGVSTAQLQA